MPDIDSLLDRNRAFADSGAWRNTPRLPFLPFKNLYVISCIDPRTDPADFLGLELGEAIVARGSAAASRISCCETSSTSVTSSSRRHPRDRTLRQL
jgi:carbonic anhydrase